MQLPPHPFPLLSSKRIEERRKLKQQQNPQKQILAFFGKAKQLSEAAASVSNEKVIERGKKRKNEEEEEEKQGDTEKSGEAGSQQFLETLSEEVFQLRGACEEELGGQSEDKSKQELQHGKKAEKDNTPTLYRPLQRPLVSNSGLAPKKRTKMEGKATAAAAKKKNNSQQKTNLLHFFGKK